MTPTSHASTPLQPRIPPQQPQQTIPDSEATPMLAPAEGHGGLVH
jgi:hypothetical protein